LRFIITFLVVFSLATQGVISQSSQENPKREHSEIEESCFAKKLKSRQTWEYIVNIPGRILFFPFWLFDKALEPVLSLVGVFPQVTSKLAQILISADGRRGVLPTISDRTGHGIKFFQKDLINPGSDFDITARVGMRWRQFFRIRMQRLKWSGSFQSSFHAHYLHLPTERYYGIGNDTIKDNVRDFAFTQLSFRTSFGMKLNERTNVAAVFGLDENKISKGRDPKIESIKDLPLDEKQKIPGLSDRIALFNLQVQLLILLLSTT